MSYEERKVAGPLYPRPPEPDYRAIAELCLRHREGPEKCLETFERLATQLKLSAKTRLRVRHLLLAYNKLYFTIKEEK